MICGKNLIADGVASYFQVWKPVLVLSPSPLFSQPTRRHDPNAFKRIFRSPVGKSKMIEQRLVHNFFGFRICVPADTFLHRSGPLPSLVRPKIPIKSEYGISFALVVKTIVASRRNWRRYLGHAIYLLI